MNYEVVEGKEDVFERAFSHVNEAFQEGAGHLGSQLFKDVRNSRSYLILSEWKTKQDFDVFIQSEAFKKVTNWGKEQILANRPSHREYYSDPS